MHSRGLGWYCIGRTMPLHAPSSPVRRFLSWEQPAIFAAAAVLCEHSSDGELDLGSLIVVTPGSRAGRLLNLRLSQWARERGLLYTPPTLATPGRLLSELFPLRGTAAPDCVQQLAWLQVLTSSQDLAVLLPRPPAPEDHAAWNRYAALLSSTARQLAGDNLRPAEVPETAALAERTPTEPPSTELWKLFDDLLHRVQTLLAECSLVLPEQELLHAVRNSPSPVNKHVVLVAMTELSGLARRVLESYQGSITALIPAPELHSAKFDEFGCVIPHLWNASIAGIPDSAIAFCDTPASQAEEVLGTLASLEKAPAAHDVIVSAPDPDIAPRLVSLSDEVGGVRFRDAAVSSADNTSPAVLLSCMSTFLASKSLDDLLALLRHPHMEAAMGRALRTTRGVARGTTWWIGLLAEYGVRRAPTALDGTWQETSLSKASQLDSVYAALNSLMGSLMEDPSRRGLAEWTEPIRDALTRVYAHRRIRLNSMAGRRTSRALALVAEALATLSQVPRTLSPAEGTPASRAIEVLLGELRASSIPPEPAGDAIEVVGWLDAALDPSPIALFTGMNESIVPERVASHELIPESLRVALNLSSNSSRLGRDSYLLALAYHARRRDGCVFRCICGRRSAANDPLWPSRLLLPEATQARRILQLLKGVRPSVRVHRAHVPGGVDRFETLPIPATPTPESMRVTDFKAFLNSPYSYYVERLLGLEEHDAPAVELGPLEFGSLVHDALKLFGRSAARDSADPAEIERELNIGLDAVATREFGDKPRTEVKIQIEIAKRRLASVARIEADRRREGWRIVETEWNPTAAPTELVVDGVPMTLTGRIDRIDRNNATGQWEIIDYKTGDSAEPPNKTHVQPKSGEWVDLQLPLYVQLAAPLLQGAHPTLSYFCVPRDPEKTGITSLKVDSLEGAYETAAEVIRDIRAGNFKDVGNSDAEGSLGALMGIGHFSQNAPVPKIPKEDGDDESGGAS